MDTEVKKKRKRQPAYKSVAQRGSMSSIDDAFNALTELGDDVQSIVDNAPEGLNQSERIQTLEETASTIQGFDLPDVPESLTDEEFTYSESVPTRKGRQPSRAVQASNAAAVFRAAAERAQEVLDNSREKWEAWDEWEGLDLDEQEARREKDEEPEEPQVKQDDEADVETFISELEDLASEAENLQFPGMMG